MPPPRAVQLIEAATLLLPGSRHPALDAETLFRGISGMSRAEVLAGGNENIPSEVAARFQDAVLRRSRHEPIQYILGSTAFWRDEFTVNPAVLIPRPDTEILVEAVALRLRDHPAPRLLDVGTGSGCIALSLLREHDRARALAIDVSEQALEVAKENAQRLGLQARIDFRISHWLNAIGSAEEFDVIVSNPPYVARDSAVELESEVRDFEPGLALFADTSDDLSSYRAIVFGIGPRLTASGLLAFEVGMGQSERVIGLLRSAGFRATEVVNDLAGISRVVLGRRP